MVPWEGPIVRLGRAQVCGIGGPKCVALEGPTSMPGVSGKRNTGQTSVVLCSGAHVLCGLVQCERYREEAASLKAECERLMGMVAQLSSALDKATRGPQRSVGRPWLPIFPTA
jgi:hypothetical protein